MSCRHLTGTALLLVAIAIAPVLQASWQEWGPPPAVGLTPVQRIGGFVSIPGAPLPPMAPSSIRNALRIIEPGIQGLRLLGKTRALALELGYTATLHAALGEAERADELFDEAQAIMETLKTDPKYRGWLNNNRGLVRITQGKYVDAKHYFQSALKALEGSSQDYLEPRAIVQQNLATICVRLDEFEESENHYLAALAILLRLHKDTSFEYVATRLNLAVLYTSFSDFRAARAILEELVNGKPSYRYLHYCALNTLGCVLRALKDFPSAETRVREAMASASEGSQEQAVALANLTSVLVGAGRYTEAWHTGDEAMAILRSLHGENSPTAIAVAGTMGTAALFLGDIDKAGELLRNTAAALSRQPGNQDAMAGILHTLAAVEERQGNREEALKLSGQALALDELNLRRILDFGTESQRLLYRDNMFPYDQLAEIGDPNLLARAVLEMKGAVLESLLAERAVIRRSRSAEDREQLERIAELKIQVMERLERSDRDAGDAEIKLARAETTLAEHLSQSSFPHPDPPDLKQISNAIPAGSILIEIIRFRQLGERGKVVLRYGAILFPHQENPLWVPLGAAEPIDQLIDELSQRMDAGGRGVRPTGQPGDTSGILRQLNDRLWKPLQNALPGGTRGIIFSPDGPTHFVPWAALLDENGRFLAERWAVSETASGRDLVRAPAASANRTLLALADALEDLPGSRTEAGGIRDLATARGWQPTVLCGEKATKIALFQHPHPRILHFATHGEWEAGQTQWIDSHLSRQAMYRGYLLLGGARQPVAARDEGTQRRGSDAGILTAEEVAGLDLQGTWLTVLSACRSGAGDARDGEGVLGLRRGFALAGTENLLFALWSVDDAATGHFMTAFYARLFRTGDPVLAFQDTQRQELRNTAERRGIDKSVQLAGAFVMTGLTGRSEAKPSSAIRTTSPPAP